MIDDAIELVKGMRYYGIPVWLCGGVAHDYYTGENIEHKDIDLFVSDIKYRGLVNVFMTKNNYIKKTEFGNIERYKNKDYGTIVDIIYETYPPGKQKPTKLSIDSLSLPIEVIIEGFQDVVENLNSKIESLDKIVKKHEYMINKLKEVYKDGH